MIHNHKVNSMNNFQTISNTVKIICNTIICILLIEVILAVSYILLPHEVERYESPDRQYILIVKSEFRFFAMPGGGGSSSAPALIILKDKDGNQISTSDDAKEECGVDVGSIWVEWDLENDMVYYAKARGVNVKTGEIGC